MRLFLLFVLSSLFKPADSGTIKIEFGLHCPDKTNWEYKISSWVIIKPAGEVSVKATDHFEFRTLVNEEAQIRHLVNHTCTADGKWQTGPSIGFYAPDNTFIHFFNALNLKSEDDKSAVYEKLFFHYLQKECPTGDCSAIRDLIYHSCEMEYKIYVEKIRMPKTKICKDSFDKALKLILENRFTSTLPSVSSDAAGKTTIFIIVGSVVGVVLLIAAVVTYFICKKKKNKQTGSGMTGTGTNSKTMTKSGTTKQGTTTGTFQKTGTVGTGGTGNTTTGGQRY